MAFHAFIQKLFCDQQEKIYDSLEIINALAKQLDIDENQINDIIKQTVDKGYVIQDKYISQDEIQQQIDDIEKRFHPQEKKSRKVVNLVDKQSLDKLDLIKEYETFHLYYKQGCTLEQLKELRNQMLEKVKQYVQ